MKKTILKYIAIPTLVTGLVLGGCDNSNSQDFLKKIDSKTKIECNYNEKEQNFVKYNLGEYLNDEFNDPRLESLPINENQKKDLLGSLHYSLVLKGKNPWLQRIRQ